jgi:HEAT repeat protein
VGDDGDAFQRVFAAELAEDTGYLVAALTDSVARRVAARSLGHLADRGVVDSRAVPPLRVMLKAEEPHARASAARALAKMQAQVAADEVCDIAHVDPVWWVRTWAIVGLGELPVNDALAELEGFLIEDDHRIRWAAAEGLRQLGDPNGIPALREAMKKERWTKRGPYRKAIRALTGL